MSEKMYWRGGKVPIPQHDWITRFTVRAALSLKLRVADAARCGRPRTAHQIIDPLIDEIIDTDPRDLGYRSTIWTAALLQQYLHEQHQIPVCTKSGQRGRSRGWGLSGSVPAMPWPCRLPTGDKPKGAQTRPLDAPAHGGADAR